MSVNGESTRCPLSRCASRCLRSVPTCAGRHRAASTQPPGVRTLWPVTASSTGALALAAPVCAGMQYEYVRMPMNGPRIQKTVCAEPACAEPLEGFKRCARLRQAQPERSYGMRTFAQQLPTQGFDKLSPNGATVCVRLHSSCPRKASTSSARTVLRCAYICTAATRARASTRSAPAVSKD